MEPKVAEKTQQQKGGSKKVARAANRIKKFPPRLHSKPHAHYGIGISKAERVMWPELGKPSEADKQEAESRRRGGSRAKMTRYARSSRSHEGTEGANLPGR